MCCVTGVNEESSLSKKEETRRKRRAWLHLSVNDSQKFVTLPENKLGLRDPIPPPPTGQPTRTDFPSAPKNVICVAVIYCQTPDTRCIPSGPYSGADLGFCWRPQGWGAANPRPGHGVHVCARAGWRQIIREPVQRFVIWQSSLPALGKKSESEITACKRRCSVRFSANRSALPPQRLCRFASVPFSH